MGEKEFDIKLEISKKAGLLGKEVSFSDVPARIDLVIEQNAELFEDYIDRNPVHRSIQVSGEMSEHEVQSTTVFTDQTCGIQGFTFKHKPRLGKDLNKADLQSRGIRC